MLCPLNGMQPCTNACALAVTEYHEGGVRQEPYLETFCGIVYPVRERHVYGEMHPLLVSRADKVGKDGGE